MAVPLKLLLLEDRPADAELLLFELQDAGYDPGGFQPAAVQCAACTQLA
jgi:hypothetical protein